MSIDSPDRARKPRGTKRAMVIVIVVAALLAIGGYWLAHSSGENPPARGARGAGRGGPGGAGGPGGGAGGMPMPVGVAKVANGDIDITLNALGTVTPLRNVTITAQVAGNLQKVNFKEGQAVKEGDALAEIDPRPYQAQLTQYEGALARDEALLANAKIDLDRYTTLFSQDSIAKQQLDSQKSLVHQYEGTVKSDQGQIDNAKVNIGYTKIMAPVSGRVGLRQVDPGNNVSVGGSIVVITQLKPIDVLFTIPEDNLPPVLKKMHAGDKLQADAYDRAGTTKIATGSLASLDIHGDTSTGTVKAKAEFTNADELFWEHIRADASAEESVRDAGEANTIDNFAHIFHRKLEELVIGRMDRNSDQVVRFLDNPEVREFVTRLMRNQVYSRIQDDAKSRAAEV